MENGSDFNVHWSTLVRSSMYVTSKRHWYGIRLIDLGKNGCCADMHVGVINIYPYDTTSRLRYELVVWRPRQRTPHYKLIN